MHECHKEIDLFFVVVVSSPLCPIQSAFEGCSAYYQSRVWELPEYLNGRERVASKRGQKLRDRGFNIHYELYGMHFQMFLSCLGLIRSLVLDNASLTSVSLKLLFSVLIGGIFLLRKN